MMWEGKCSWVCRHISFCIFWELRYLSEWLQNLPYRIPLTHCDNTSSSQQYFSNCLTLYASISRYYKTTATQHRIRTGKLHFPLLRDLDLQTRKNVMLKRGRTLQERGTSVLWNWKSLPRVNKSTWGCTLCNILNGWSPLARSFFSAVLFVPSSGFVVKWIDKH